MITFAAFNTKQYDTERRNGPRTEPATAEDPDGLPAVQRLLRKYEIGMTFEMLQILYQLRTLQGVSQQQLAEATARDKACITSLINNLEKKGWVQRKQSPDDRRARQIFLTDEGVRMSEQTKPLLKEIYDRIGAATPPRQMQECRKQLGKLNAILDGI